MARYISLVSLVFLLFGCFPLDREAKITPDTQLKKTPPLTAERLKPLLPEDADTGNMERQLRAAAKGFYWSTTNQIRLLDLQG